MLWMLTVPFSPMDIVLVMKLEAKDASNQCLPLGASAALIIIWSYPAELDVEGDSGQRWSYCLRAMLPFLCSIYELSVVSPPGALRRIRGLPS